MAGSAGLERPTAPFVLCVLPAIVSFGDLSTF